MNMVEERPRALVNDAKCITSIHTVQISSPSASSTSRVKSPLQLQNLGPPLALGPQRRMSSSPPGEETATVFRRAERYWKSKTCPPDPSHAFCPESVTSWPSDGHSRWKAWTVRRLPLSAPYPCPECLYERQQAFAYAFIDQPGVLFLPAFFCRHAQAFLAKECFEEATGPSHRTNLDAPYRRDRGRGAEGLYGLWERWRRRRPGEDEEEFVLGARAEGGEDLHIAEVWEKGKMRWSVLGWQ